jgi:hypothetical protein
MGGRVTDIQEKQILQDGYLLHGMSLFTFLSQTIQMQICSRGSMRLL